ncbi:hypothetical protein V8C42DRAFT_341926 [Trichoderma barbatum]
MKFFATLLFAAVGVSAAGSATTPDGPGSSCLADYILEDCLVSTTKTANACKPTDYDCLCAAYQAVLTCYNNCPNDIRGPSVQQQVDSYCRTASQLSPKSTVSTPKTKTQDSSNSEETSGSGPNNEDASATDSVASQTTGSRAATTTGARSSSTNAAATMGSVAGIVMAVAGAAVAMI